MAKHILIVDDDQNIRRVLRAIFTRLGHRVSEVSNGLEATQIVRRQTFDLITMDMTMGQLDGIDAISILQNETDTPIVVISAHLTPNIHTDLEARGISVRLSKPFLVEQIIEVASNILEQG